ncbi:AbfB domain-containing protein [Streptomyces sp. NPDC003247]|uniref:AbfB domain-containing protein n=1 Tax=Streptomyces sp. NPDC003247 TaxID=3364677 RepID=UPI00367E5C99
MGSNDDSVVFRADATCCVRNGSEEGSKALFAFNSPFSYLLHRDDDKVWLDPEEGADGAYADSRSFRFVNP